MNWDKQKGEEEEEEEGRYGGRGRVRFSKKIQSSTLKKLLQVR
jgi:hypothetical protein